MTEGEPQPQAGVALSADEERFLDWIIEVARHWMALDDEALLEACETPDMVLWLAADRPIAGLRRRLQALIDAKSRLNEPALAPCLAFVRTSVAEITAPLKGSYAHFLHECGYQHVRRIDHTMWAALERKLYTTAITIGDWGDKDSVSDSWCYRSAREALAALVAWEGNDWRGEPKGWIRHPDTGRRVSTDPDERDETGRVVGAVGVLYIRP